MIRALLKSNSHFVEGNTMWIPDKYISAINSIEKLIQAIQSKRAKGEKGVKVSATNKKARTEFNSIFRIVWQSMPGNRNDLHPKEYSLPDYSHEDIITDVAKTLHSFLFLGLNLIQVHNKPSLASTYENKFIVRNISIPTIKGLDSLLFTTFA